MFGPITPSELPNKFAMAVRTPIGVCGMIAPWNFPMAIPSWKLLPAIVCGNTCVIKPAQDTPLSTFNLVKALEDAGLPKGAVVADKIAWLRNRVATLPAREQPVFSAQLDTIASAVASRDYATAMTAVDALSSRAQADAGSALLDSWRAGGADNQAGDLIAGAATLKYSIGYLRDFGQ